MPVVSSIQKIKQLIEVSPFISLYKEQSWYSDMDSLPVEEIEHIIDQLTKDSEFIKSSVEKILQNSPDASREIYGIMRKHTFESIRINEESEDASKSLSNIEALFSL